MSNRNCVLIALMLVACGGEMNPNAPDAAPEPGDPPVDAGSIAAPRYAVGDPCKCGEMSGSVAVLAGLMCLVEAPQRVACELVP